MLSEWMEVETLEVPRVRKQMGTSGYVEETRQGTYLILRVGVTVQFGQVKNWHFHKVIASVSLSSLVYCESSSCSYIASGSSGNTYRLYA
jgi:hypothetical protein